jgi:F420-non-reducing hydrogenase iron-sulfur subunit
MHVVARLLDVAGIGRDRMQLRWVSAAEGQIFADFVKELSAIVGEKGSFNADEYKLKLAAVEGALNAPRLRWVLGMDRQLTECGNVYNQKIDETLYHQMVDKITEEEFQKAIILEVLSDGPQSVREIASKSELPVYTVSQLLTDIEKAGKVELQGYEGSTPKFIRLAA